MLNPFGVIENCGVELDWRGSFVALRKADLLTDIVLGVEAAVD
jgi:hypothetical protein